MKLILKSDLDNFKKTIFFNKMQPYENLAKGLPILKGQLKATLITNDKEINANELRELIFNFEKSDIKLIKIYSDSRETIITGKSLKISSKLVESIHLKDEPNIGISDTRRDTLHKGTIRSGDRISSNGDLFIAGDVNPGAIISASKNIYVWGKLLGIAVAGKDGNKDSSIASLYLNPLQIRICDMVALGPKERPSYDFPEIAVIENQAIIIKPYIIGK